MLRAVHAVHVVALSFRQLALGALVVVPLSAIAVRLGPEVVLGEDAVGLAAAQMADRFVKPLEQRLSALLRDVDLCDVVLAGVDGEAGDSRREVLVLVQPLPFQRSGLLFDPGFEGAYGCRELAVPGRGGGRGRGVGLTVVYFVVIQADGVRDQPRASCRSA